MLGLDLTQATKDRQQPAAASVSPAAESRQSSSEAGASVEVRGMRTRVINRGRWRVLAVLAEVGLAFLLLEPLVQAYPGFPPFITFYPAVVLAGLLDGMWAGVAAVSLSALVTDIWIFEPIGHLSIAKIHDTVSLTSFCVLGICISAILEQHHRNRERQAAYLAKIAVLAERKKAAAEIQAERSAAQFQTIFDNVEERLYVCDGRGNPVLANALSRQAYGKPDRSIVPVLGMERDIEVFDADMRLLARSQWPISRVLAGEHVHSAEIRVRFKATGEERVLNCNGEPIQNQDGKIVMAVLSSSDITERKQAEESLAKAKREWERTFNSIPDLIAILDNQHRIVRMNQAMAERIGKSPEACVGAECFRCVHGATCPPGICPHTLTLQDGRGHAAELHESRLGGDFLVTTTPLLDERGKMDGAVHVARDITDRKRAEAELTKLNRTLKALSNSNQAILHAADEPEFLTEICGIIVKDCGYAMVWIGRAESDEDKTVRPVAHAGAEDRYLDTLRVNWSDDERGRGPTGLAIRTGRPSMCRNMRSDPAFSPWREEALKRGYISSLVIPLKLEESAWGAITIYSSTLEAFSDPEVELLTELARDLEFGLHTLRVRAAHARAEQELRENEELLGLFVEHAPAALAMFDREMHYLYASRRWKADHGMHDCDLAGLSHYEVFPAVSDRWKDAHRRGLAGEVLRSEAERVVRADGTQQWIRWEIRPWLDAHGEVGGIVIFSEDFTERKEAEEALLRNEKMAMQREQLRALAERLQQAREEERTRLARDLHDDIGQILTAIKMDLSWIEKRVENPGTDIETRFRSTVELINEGVRSVRKICSGLRPAILDDLGLAAAIEWQANEFASRTGIECRVSVPPGELNLSREQTTAFFRIFQECLTNVNRHARARSVSVQLHSEGDDLLLVVQDDGVGFQETGESKSLGLLGMKERAQACGGDVQIVSLPQHGTTVTLRVPVYARCSTENDNAHSDSR